MINYSLREQERSQSIFTQKFIRPYMLDMDQCLEYVNPSGRYQKLLFMILLAQATFSSFTYIGVPYFFQDPIFICQNGQECSQKDSCAEGIINISPNSNKTITQVFDLYCDRQYLKNLSISFIFIGSLVGTFLFSFISDLKGRRISIIIAWLLSVMGIGLFSFAQNISMLIAGQFFAGLGIYPSGTIGIVILNEQSIGKFRKIATGFLILGITFGECLMNLLGFLLHNNWTILARYWYFIPMLILQFSTFYIIESPRFFLNKNDSKVVKLLNTIALRNRSLTENKLLLTEKHIDFHKYTLNGNKQIYSYFTLFKYPSTRWITIACSLQKFLMTFTNFGMTFSISVIGFNIYINGFMSILAESVTYLFIGKVLNSFNRRPSILFFQITSCVFCLLFIAFPIPDSCRSSYCYQKVAQIILFFLARISTTSYFIISTIYYPELYPTSVRSLGLGFVRGFGISGSIITPFVITWSQQIGISPLVSFGIIGSFACLFSFFLPETQSKPLGEEIEEVKQMKENLIEQGEEKIVD